MTVLSSISLNAIVGPDNMERWTKPTDKAPDNEVPGFLVNLGPTAARAVLTENTFVVKHIFADSPAHSALELDDEITGIDDHPFAEHTFGKAYSMDPGPGLEGPMMDFGRASEEAEGTDGSLRLNVLRKGKKIKLTIQLEPIGRFSDTFPIDCAKSKKLVDDAMDYLLTHKSEHTGMVHEKGKYGLALLARGKLQEAEALAMAWNEPPDEKSWTWYPS